MKETLDKLWGKTKEWGKEVGYFLSSLLFLKNFAAMIGTIALFLLMTFWWMRCYTSHGESLQVQDYIGMNLNDAMQKAEDRSFEIVVSDSIFVLDKDPNLVLNQDPKPLSRVKKNRRVYLTITKSNAEKVRLPDLVGNYDYNQYTKKLKMKDVKSKIRERVFNNKYEENTILHFYYNDQKITDDDLKKGVKIPKGTTLEFVVTEQGGGVVDVPSLVCKKYTEAEFLISGMQLNMGTVHEDATITRRSSAYVWRQVPPYVPGKTMRMGEQIDIYLTQYRPDGCNSDGTLQ